MIWKKEPSKWSKILSSNDNLQTKEDEHLRQTKQVLEELLQDKRISTAGKRRLKEEYQQLRRYIEKLEHQHIHIAVFGRVSVGKSALLNALVGNEVFPVSVLHGETKQSQDTLWREYDSGGVFLIDTPGIDEIDDKERSSLAETVARKSDIILFVVDGDLTAIEWDYLVSLNSKNQPMFLLLNKADLYDETEQVKLMAHLKNRVKDYVPAQNVMAVTAIETKQIYLETIDGKERKITQIVPAQIEVLKSALWRVLDSQGKSYAALNAAIFAEKMSTRISQEIITAKKDVADTIIRYYALSKAIGVAINPVPLIDLLALAADGIMVYHLSRLYGFSFTKQQSTKLLITITTQAGFLMSAVYGTQLISSMLKGLTAGFSTIITSSAQAGIAFYGSYVIGKAAEQYFIQGASWGEKSAKQIIKEIVKDLDKQALMDEAQASIRQILRKNNGE